MWCVRRGRRLRESILVERSLDSLVLHVHSKDAPRPGTRIRPADPTHAARLEFRSALVTESNPIPGSATRVVAEIES